MFQALFRALGIQQRTKQTEVPALMEVIFQCAETKHKYVNISSMLDGDECFGEKLNWENRWGCGWGVMLNFEMGP